MISSNINEKDTIKPVAFLKWGNHVIGRISKDNNVNIISPNFNETVRIYTNDKTYWTEDDFRNFLKDRIVSPNRRDIEKVLFNCGLSSYDVFGIAYVTRAINTKDSFWIAEYEDEDFNKVINILFNDLLRNKPSLTGSPVYSPDGVNVKCYGVDGYDFGIYKKRLHPMSSDVESEVAVYKLANLMGINCCEARLSAYPLVENNKRKDGDRVAFSKFEYHPIENSIVHARRFLTQKDREQFNSNEYTMLVNKFPDFKKDIIRMIVLDFVTRQTDRHWCNFAIKVDRLENKSFYPLYDNGRSLFFEDSEPFVKEAVKDLDMYSTEFGIVGTYFDYIHDIIDEGINISSLVNLDITKGQLHKIYSESGIFGYRLNGAIEWTHKALKYLREMGQ